MQIYLPIAEMSVDIFLILGMGAGIGFLSGLFGVGGGFLMTPLLIFIGVPPAVAVGTEANQIVASSVSGVLAHWRRGNVDIKMGVVLLVGGLVGSFLGVWLFKWLRGLGQIDLTIALSYVVFLGLIGGMMFWESVSSWFKSKKSNAPPARGGHRHTWIHGLPFKMRFRKSKLYISAILPFGVGVVVGILAAIMGVGGGFIMVPAMIYLLGMPTKVVVGTSLFQIIFTTAFTTVAHAVTSHSVDILLASVLILGGVFGAQLGTQLGARLRGEHLRILLALLVLAVCAKVAMDLLITPDEAYSIRVAGRH